MAALTENLPTGHWRVFDARSVLGSALLAQGRTDEAEPLLLAAPAVLADRTDAASKYTRQAIERVVELYERTGRPERASRWRERPELAESSQAPG